MRPKTDAEEYWKDDWHAAEQKLEDALESEHPRNPQQVVDFYQYGFIAARRHPSHEWSDVERELYEDYVGGMPEPEPSLAQGEDLNWEEVREWARRGWEEAQAPGVYGASGAS